MHILVQMSHTVEDYSQSWTRLLLRLLSKDKMKFQFLSLLNILLPSSITPTIETYQGSHISNWNRSWKIRLQRQIPTNCHHPKQWILLRFQSGIKENQKPSLKLLSEVLNTIQGNFHMMIGIKFHTLLKMLTRMLSSNLKLM